MDNSKKPAKKSLIPVRNNRQRSLPSQQGHNENKIGNFKSLIPRPINRGQSLPVKTSRDRGQRRDTKNINSVKEHPSDTIIEGFNSEKYMTGFCRYSFASTQNLEHDNETNSSENLVWYDFENITEADNKLAEIVALVKENHHKCCQTAFVEHRSVANNQTETFTCDISIQKGAESFTNAPQSSKKISTDLLKQITKAVQSDELFPVRIEKSITQDKYDNDEDLKNEIEIVVHTSKDNAKVKFSETLPCKKSSVTCVAVKDYTTQGTSASKLITNVKETGVQNDEGKQDFECYIKDLTIVWKHFPRFIGLLFQSEKGLKMLRQIVNDHRNLLMRNAKPLPPISQYIIKKRKSKSETDLEQSKTENISLITNNEIKKMIIDASAEVFKQTKICNMLIKYMDQIKRSVTIFDASQPQNFSSDKQVQLIQKLQYIQERITKFRKETKCEVKKNLHLIKLINHCCKEYQI